MLLPRQQAVYSEELKSQNGEATPPRDKVAGSEQKHPDTPGLGVTFYANFKDLSPTKRDILSHGRREDDT